tara:strand:- start:59 stop:586 length:528 start_codon:yes stop_codon:yes gene_type:complete
MKSDKDVVTVNTTTTDTIYRTVHTKQIDTLIITKNPKPITIIKDFDISIYTDSIQILNALIEATKIRTYEKTYEDSTYSATVTIKTKGELLESRFKHVLKPRKFQIKETHTTEKKFPKYSLYYGIRLNTGSLPNTNPSLGGSFGFQSKKGTIYSIGYDTNLTWSVGIQKRFFTKY